MTKKIEPPMTAEEVQKKLRSGELKIVFAESPLVDQYKKQVSQILLAVGKWMSEDADDWANGAFVSDMSSFGDFDLDDDELALVSAEIGIGIKKDDYIFAVAARMAGAN